MEFGSESEMKDVAIGSLNDEFQQNAIEVVPEFDYGPGRTDLVFVNLSNKYWERRIDKLGLSTPIQKKTYLQAFLQLHGRGPITEEYYYSIGAMRDRPKREALNWLKSNGFIEEQDGKIRSTRKLRPHVTTSIAVELKLRKWKDALKQAHRGRAFADYKYVALDKDHVQPAIENIDLFKEKEVGLMSIDSEGNCTKHYSPSRGNPYSHLNRWKLNEITVSKRV
jgi:hypothetical protein